MKIEFSKNEIESESEMTKPLDEDEVQESEETIIENKMFKNLEHSLRVGKS